MSGKFSRNCLSRKFRSKVERKTVSLQRKGTGTGIKILSRVKKISRDKSKLGIRKFLADLRQGLKILYKANVYLRHHPRVLLGRIRTSVYTRPMSPEHADFQEFIGVGLARLASTFARSMNTISEWNTSRQTE